MAVGRRGISGLGVADGVYMWKEQGIDSGRFSKALMASALDAMRQGAHDVLTGGRFHLTRTAGMQTCNRTGSKVAHAPDRIKDAFPPA